MAADLLHKLSLENDAVLPQRQLSGLPSLAARGKRIAMTTNLVFNDGCDTGTLYKFGDEYGSCAYTYTDVIYTWKVIFYSDSHTNLH